MWKALFLKHFQGIFHRKFHFQNYNDYSWHHVDYGIIGISLREVHRPRTDLHLRNENSLNIRYWNRNLHRWKRSLIPLHILLYRWQNCYSQPSWPARIIWWTTGNAIIQGEYLLSDFFQMTILHFQIFHFLWQIPNRINQLILWQVFHLPNLQNDQKQLLYIENGHTSAPTRIVRVANLWLSNDYIIQQISEDHVQYKLNHFKTH